MWGWHAADCLNTYGEFKSQTILDQCKKYIANNGSRSTTVQFTLRTDGTINAQLCDRFPYVIRRAAFMAQAYENVNDNTTHGATLILVVIWEVFSDMRFVFYVLWKTKFKKKHKNDRPKLIRQMIVRGFRAGYIAYNLCYVLVSEIYIFEYIHILNVTLL